MTTLTLEKNSLVLQTKYHQGLLYQIKSLPQPERKWDNDRKVWLIDPKHGQTVARWVETYLGEIISVPQTANLQPATEIRKIEVRYIGRCKERNGDWSAFGWVGDEWGKWSVLFPEDVLREWFEGNAASKGRFNGTSLYGILGIQQTATPDQVKTAYRRMAKIWHPDVNREPDADERFKRVNEAYQIISDPKKRSRYDAGLELEATITNGKKAQLDTARPHRIILGYRSPVLCGYVTAEGHEQLGTFIVHKILDFEDIKNDQGQILMTSWPQGSDHFVEAWV